MPSLFRIGATVRSANKPAVGDNTYVEAKDADEAERKGRKHLQKKHPHGNVEVTKVVVKREGDRPKRGPWW
ncbi:hypothetical protein [Streptomyces albidoflavus]|uniref:hypothetical protein n=1 Tax=Streptomyces albidoflavus TaxID=1886 RepID=UPI0033170A64